MTPPAIDDELVRPNLLGSRLARYRTRAYRFTDDQRHYVLAERLEEIFLDGRQAHPATVEYVEDCLMSIRATGQVPRFDPAVAAAEGIDAELITREPYYYTHALPGVEPEQVIVILGAPRSGTSHLINLLAHTRRFAYLTTATCWAWPIRNLTDPSQHLFTSLGKAPSRSMAPWGGMPAARGNSGATWHDLAGDQQSRRGAAPERPRAAAPRP